MIYNIKSIDGKLQGQFEGTSAKDAAINAFNSWGSELKSKIEVTKEAPKPIRAAKCYTCDYCRNNIDKGDLYFRVNRTIGNPKNTIILPGTIVHNHYSYTAHVCTNCKRVYSRSTS